MRTPEHHERIERERTESGYPGGSTYLDIADVISTLENRSDAATMALHVLHEHKAEPGFVPARFIRASGLEPGDSLFAIFFEEDLHESEPAETDALFAYQFQVSGGSPGNGETVIAARSYDEALESARAHVERINSENRARGRKARYHVEDWNERDVYSLVEPGAVLYFDDGER